MALLFSVLGPSAVYAENLPVAIPVEAVAATTRTYIVELADDESAAQFVQEAAASGLGLSLTDTIDDKRIVVSVPGDVPPGTVESTLASFESVAAADSDDRMYALDAPAPNDERWSALWGLDESSTAQGIGVLSAWDITKGSPGVVVAVIDTGLIKHPEFKKPLTGWDFVDDNGDVSETDGSCGASAPTFHGTHVAGTIAAAANNKIGVAGIAPLVSVLPVRVLNHCGSGATSDVQSAMLWAAGLPVDDAPSNPTPAKVINLSLGSAGSCQSTMQSTVNEVLAAGVIIVAAAGNSNAAVGSPANCTGVIAVTAGTAVGARASFSNFGTEADVMAPGASILSTYRDPLLSTNWNIKKFGVGYGSMSGTSMASPHVAGVAALLASVDPTLTASEAETILKETARDFPATCTGCGAGLLDAGDAVDAVVPTAGAVSPRSQEVWTFDAKPNLQWAGFTSAKVLVELVQGDRTGKLGTFTAAAGRGSVTVPGTAKGFTAGAATVRFTPQVPATAGDTLQAPFTVPVVLAAASVAFTGPFGTLGVGLGGTIAWKATGKTSDLVDLVLIDPSNTETVLKAGLKAASGSFKFVPAATMVSGYYTLKLRPANGATIAAATHVVYVGTVSATAGVSITKAQAKERLYLTVVPGFVDTPITFTLLATEGSSVIKVGSIKAKGGTGAQILLAPKSLVGKTVTFSVTASLKSLTSITCIVAVAGGPSGECSATPVTYT